jgi:hypothetical protein
MRNPVSGEAFEKLESHPIDHSGIPPCLTFRVVALDITGRRFGSSGALQIRIVTDCDDRVCKSVDNVSSLLISVCLLDAFSGVFVNF